MKIKAIISIFIITLFIISGITSAINISEEKENNNDKIETKGTLETFFPPWQHSNYFFEDSGVLTTEISADNNIGYFQINSKDTNSGTGTASGWIKHWMTWDCQIDNKDVTIKINNEYSSGLLNLEGNSNVHLKISFFIDDEVYDCEVYDITSNNELKQEYSLYKDESLSKKITLTKKTYTIGVKISYEIECSNNFKGVVGYFTKPLDDSKLIEISDSTSKTKDIMFRFSQFLQNIISRRPFLQKLLDLPFFNKDKSSVINNNGDKELSLNNDVSEVTLDIINSPSEYDLADELILTWPKPGEYDGGYTQEPYFCEMARWGQEAVNVRINVDNELAKNRAENKLQEAGVPLDRINIVVTKTSSIWSRDYGPAFIEKNGELALIDFGYYQIWQRPLDNIFPTVYALQNNIDFNFLTNFEMSYQGGNYMTDGDGRAFLAVDRCIDDNSRLEVYEMENILKKYLGLSEVIFVASHIMDSDHGGDETGHIDMFSKLLDDNTLLLARWEDQNDVNAHIVEQNKEIFDEYDYNIIRIPIIRDPDNYEIIWTYTNSIIINGIYGKVVLVPQYNCEHDQEALDIYQNVMPGYDIIGINCNTIIPYYGAIHYTTITRPKI